MKEKVKIKRGDKLGLWFKMPKFKWTYIQMEAEENINYVFDYEKDFKKAVKQIIETAMIDSLIVKRGSIMDILK